MRAQIRKAMKPDPQGSFAPGHGQGCGKVKVEGANEAIGPEEADAEAHRAMVEGDQSKGQKCPEDQGMGQPGEGALANDLGLAENFPEEIRDAFGNGEKMEVGVFFRLEDLVEDLPEPTPEQVA